MYYMFAIISNCLFFLFDVLTEYLYILILLNIIILDNQKGGQNVRKWREE